MNRLALFVLLLGCAAAPAVTRAGSKQVRLRECEHASDCVLLPRSCCGECGAAASSDVRSVPRTASRARPARCDHVACPDCEPAPDPALLPTCSRDGACGVLDLHTSALSRCTTDTDCAIRPRGCCECGATEYVAIRAHADAAYTRRACDPIESCLACASPPPPLTARCRSHHCAIAP